MDTKKSTSGKVWVGLDVAKKTFDAAFISGDFKFSEASFRKILSDSFPLSKTGIRLLLKWLKKVCISQDFTFVMESTGSYSKKLFNILHELEPASKVAIANAYKTSVFIKSLGLNIKTDRTDSKALAIYGKERSPRLYEKQNEFREQLMALTRERSDLVGKVTGLKNKVSEGLRANESSVVADVLRSVIKSIESGIKRLEKAIQTMIQKNKKLANEFRLLTSVVGVGPITATIVMGELGDLDRFKKGRELSSFVGLNPRIHTSGTSVHKRPRMSKKGNAQVRKVLYMAAMSAYRDRYFEGFIDRLLKAGKSKMKIIGAVMRKLMVLMRAVIITGKPFDRNYQKETIST